MVGKYSAENREITIKMIEALRDVPVNIVFQVFKIDFTEPDDNVTLEEFLNERLG